jgi:hypothetical protein
MFVARRPQTATFTESIALEALERVLPQAAIIAAARGARRPTVRRRKLPGEVTLLLCVAMRLFTSCVLEVVLTTMGHGQRLWWPDPDLTPASKSAMVPARAQLGAGPVVRLFRAVCRPLATPDTRWYLLVRRLTLHGLRLMAIDGTTEDVPDWPVVSFLLTQSSVPDDYSYLARLGPSHPISRRISLPERHSTGEDALQSRKPGGAVNTGKYASYLATDRK